MINVSVNSNLSLQAARLSGIQAKVKDVAVSRALNGTATTVRAAASRLIRDELGGALKVGEIRKALRITRATRNELRAVVAALGRKRIPLSSFKPRETASGVTVRIGSRSVNIPGAFVTKSGAVRLRTPNWRSVLYENAVRRRQRITRGGLDYPIAQLFAPGVPAAFLLPRILDTQRRIAVARFDVLFERELKFALSRG